MARLCRVDMFPGVRKVGTQTRNVKQRVVNAAAGNTQNTDGLTTVANSGEYWAVRAALMVNKYYNDMAAKMTRKHLN